MTEKKLTPKEERYPNGALKIKYQVDEKGLKQGMLEVYYESGKIKERMPFVDGNAEGVLMAYYESGKIWAEVEHKAGKRIMQREYDEAHTTLRTTFFKDDKPDKAFDSKIVAEPPKPAEVKLTPKKELYPSGAVTSDCNVDEKGRRQGVLEAYYESGKIKDKVTFVNGLADGISYSYYENGKLWAEVEYKMGVLSMQKEYNTAHTKQRITFFKDNKPDKVFESDLNAPPVQK